MKRWLVIPLLVLYAFASSGMEVRLHYCGNKVSDFAIMGGDASCCCDDKAEKGNSEHCCKNETISVAKITDQLSNGFNIWFSLIIELNQPEKFSFLSRAPLPHVVLQNKESLAHAPPNKGVAVPLYQLYHCLVLYA